MRLIFTTLCCILLTGCLQTVPVKRTFPEIPEVLLKSCPDLQEVEAGTTKLSDVLKVVTNNYAQYQECQIAVETWLEWYKTQRDIFNSAN